MKKRKFRDTWASQSDIGKRFGLSAIAVGKILTAHGLRDPQTKEVSQEAINNGWCVATPLRSGQMHYMWSIDKVNGLLNATHRPLCKAERTANEAIAAIKEAEKMSEQGQDKLGYFLLGETFDSIPADLRGEVAVHLSNKGYAEYASGWLKIDFKSNCPTQPEHGAQHRGLPLD